MEVIADLLGKPACVSGLLRMLPVDDPRLSIRAHWPGRAPATQKPLARIAAEAEPADVVEDAGEANDAG